MVNPPQPTSGLSNAMLGFLGGLGVLVALGLLLYLVAVVRGGSSESEPYESIYVSLGDSIAAGSGASDPKTTGFAALLAADEGVASLHNVAAPGAATQDVIEGQVARALVAINAGRVAFITISAGGNDLGALMGNQACARDPVPDTCPLDKQLATVEANMRTILGYLRESALRAPIVILAYPNFFSGTGHGFEAPAGRVLPELRAMLERVANDYEHVAVAAPSFEGRGAELTHVLDPISDPHPNDAGHRVIADAMAAALDEARGD